MKKVLLSLVVTGLVCSSAFGETGKISKLRITSWDYPEMTILVGSTKHGGKIKLTGDKLKEFLAIALTAKSTGATVETTRRGSDNAWNSIAIQ